MVRVKLEEWEEEQVPRHQSKTDALAAHKDPRLCPVCAEPLQRTEQGTRRERRCRECGAVWAPEFICRHCHTRRIWRGKEGSICHGCGRPHELEAGDATA